jgi:hypothetical protein
VVAPPSVLRQTPPTCVPAYITAEVLGDTLNERTSPFTLGLLALHDIPPSELRCTFVVPPAKRIRFA